MTTCAPRTPPHVRVLLHISTNNFGHGAAKLPSTKSYRT